MRYITSLLLSLTIAVMFLISPNHAPGADEKHSLSRTEVRELLENAKTPEDHKKLASYYREEARLLNEKKVEHEDDLASYNKKSMQYSSKYPTMGDHCKQLAGYYGSAAKQAQALADMHERMSTVKK